MGSGHPRMRGERVGHGPGHLPKGNVDVTVTVGKAAPAVTAPTAKTPTYTSSERELVNAGSTAGGEIQHALGEDTTTPTPRA